MRQPHKERTVATKKPHPNSNAAKTARRAAMVAHQLKEIDHLSASALDIAGGLTAAQLDLRLDRAVQAGQMDKQDALAQASYYSRARHMMGYTGERGHVFNANQGLRTMAAEFERQADALQRDINTNATRHHADTGAKIEKLRRAAAELRWGADIGERTETAGA